VVTMRDVHGMSAGEACAALSLSPQNQRVLLHRGRAALRTVLEKHYRD
jgi:RNA polymerase sigma-70 factor (ECF subfamily)